VTNEPVETAHALVERVYALLLEARQMRERLPAMEATGASEVERVLYLDMVSAFEDGLAADLGGGAGDHQGDEGGGGGGVVAAAGGGAQGMSFDSYLSTQDANIATTRALPQFTGLVLPVNDLYERGIRLIPQEADAYSRA
jgi:hypothetical protein